MSRPLTKKEKEVLSYFLSFPVKDAAYYREQLNHAVVSDICDRGDCGSISLEIDTTAAPCAPGRDSDWLVRACDGEGTHMMLDIMDGWLTHLEVTGLTPDSEEYDAVDYMSETRTTECNPDTDMSTKPQNPVNDNKIVYIK